MSPPLDVFFLIRSLNVGGAERQLTLLALALHAAGHRVRVATFYAGGPFEVELRQVGVPVFDLHKSGRWDIVPFFWRLVQLLRRERPAIVHGYLPMSNILLWLARQLGYRVARKDRISEMMAIGMMSVLCGSLGMRLMR